jgi:hypothetical protein
MTDHQDTAELAWRIPAPGEPQLFRIGLLQIAISTLFFAAIVFALAPPHMVLPAVTAVALLGLFLLWRNWRKYGAGQRRPDNVRIGAAGVTWLDESGGQHLFARADIESFRIQFDPDTLRDVPALLLALAGGYESQPIELYSPAEPERVRQLLASRLNLREETAEETARRSADHNLSGLSAMILEEDDTWELRGSRDSLLAFCARLEDIARRLASFPVGARPLPMRIGEHTLHFSPRVRASPEIEGTDFCGSSEQLIELSQRLRGEIACAASGAKVEVRLSDTVDEGRIRLAMEIPEQSRGDREENS